MAITRVNYSAEIVAAARAVLLELTRLLGEYRDDIVVVGGWVPVLLLPDSLAPHVGSVDVDLALNHRSLQESHYLTLRKLLLQRGYRQDARQPFIFYRDVPTTSGSVEVQVDLLAGEYEGTGRSHRTQGFEDARARKARGCDLAFEMYTEVRIQGTLPGGGEDQGVVRVAEMVPFLVMKGMALADRIKEKDAWDIYYCARHYPDGLDALVQEFQPYVTHGLVQEGLRKIAEKFASPTHTGPKWVTDFEEISDPDERQRVQRDAYERVHYWLEKLGIGGG